MPTIVRCIAITRIHNQTLTYAELSTWTQSEANGTPTHRTIAHWLAPVVSKYALWIAPIHYQTDPCKIVMNWSYLDGAKSCTHLHKNADRMRDIDLDYTDSSRTLLCWYKCRRNLHCPFHIHWCLPIDWYNETELGHTYITHHNVTVPIQLCPSLSIWWPRWHSQEYEPILLTQMCSQWDDEGVLHSSTSI